MPTIKMGFNGKLQDITIPAEPETRKKMAKVVRRMIFRMGVRENLREYPVPKRFRRWKKYFYHLLVNEIRRKKKGVVA